MAVRRLLITADDYGYSRRVNEGILTAARAAAVDAVSAMAGRAWCDPAPLLETGVAVGLHLEEARPGEGAAEAVRRQAAAFERLFGRAPEHLDGHHHCHASEPLATAAQELASRLGVRVRAVSREHRRALRALGVECPDRLVGRMTVEDPAEPAEVRAALGGKPLPFGLTEWAVHPGLADPELGSSYDGGREEDLELLLELRSEPVLLAARDRGPEAGR